MPAQVQGFSSRCHCIKRKQYDREFQVAARPRNAAECSSNAAAVGYASLLFPSPEAFANQSDFDGAVCVLLDINLGDGSGIELRHRLKAAGNTVPIIYMTGNDAPAVRASALQSGCLAYLTKPFSAKSLMGPLERASAGLT
jgi:FixJ family two-component response regulator